MPANVVVRRGTSGLARWETAATAVPARLAPYVRSWLGYSESAPGATRRRELPGPDVVLIFELAPPLRIGEGRREACRSRSSRGFVAGLDDGYTFTEHDGWQAGIQVNLTPLGARALFGVPLRELARTVVDLADVLPQHRALDEELSNLTTWPARFGRVERALVERLEKARDPHRGVAWALRRVAESGGGVRVQTLASDLGYSRKHLNALFLEHVGVSPKLFSSLVRFERLLRALDHRPQQPWADLALSLGFADQAHLGREVRRFAGVSPGELRILRSGAFSDASADR